jgi:hypothetical protein
MSGYWYPPPPPPPRPPGREPLGAWIFAGIAIIVGLWFAAHVMGAALTRDNPPAACQVLGGTWSAWNGWSCG